MASANIGEFCRLEGAIDWSRVPAVKTRQTLTYLEEFGPGGTREHEREVAEDDLGATETDGDDEDDDDDGEEMADFIVGDDVNE